MLSTSIRTMPGVIGILTWLLLVAVAGAQDILVFGDTSLPDCAHSCVDLYSAQYDCQNVEDRVGCFCRSDFITAKSEGWGCDESCATEVEKAKAANFLATTCGIQAEEVDNGTVVPNGANSTTSATPTAPNTSTTPTAPVDKSAGKAEKETNWPAKNWPYFVAAFFFVAIAIVVFLFAGPVHKYMRRQITKRHTHKSGGGTSPYREPATSYLSRISCEYPPRHSGTPSAYGSSAAASSVPLRGGEDIARHGPYEAMRSQTVALPSPPPIRTLFATRAATEAGRKQDGREQRMREGYEGLGLFGGGSRLAFWRRSSSSAEKGAGSAV